MIIKSAFLHFETYTPFAIHDQNDDGSLGDPVLPATQRLYYVIKNVKDSQPYDIYASSGSPSALVIPNTINGIQFDRVTKSVIRQITKPIGYSTNLEILTLGVKSKRTNRLLETYSGPEIFVPRVQLTAAETAALTPATFDSSVAIVPAFPTRMNEISHLCKTEKVDLEYNEPVIPYYYFVKATSVVLDSNHPQVLINTFSTITIEYFWEEFTGVQEVKGK